MLMPFTLITHTWKLTAATEGPNRKGVEVPQEIFTLIKELRVAIS